MLLTQAVLPYLRKPARITNVSSVEARTGLEGRLACCLGKAVVEAFTCRWTAELDPAGHTFNAVSSGLTETAMVENIPPAIVVMQKSKTSVEHRHGTVADVGYIVAFLTEECIEEDKSECW